MTDKTQEALKLALSVLDEVRSETFRLLRNGQKLYAEEKVWNAIFVIKQALAEQPAQQQDIPKIGCVNHDCDKCKAQQQEPGRNHWEDGDVFERIGAMKKQPAQQQYQSTADKCELTPVPAKGGLLPTQIDPSAGTQVSKVWLDGEKLMAQPIPLEKLYKKPEPPCKYPHCPYPCPDLPDCRDAEQPAQGETK